MEQSLTPTTFRIVNASYVTSIHHAKDLKHFPYPEVAFFGRSNVGKSSLLNALCGQKKLAKTSKTPGRTSALNYFEIEIIAVREDGKELKYSAYFVDVPGYGFAKTKWSEKKRWAELLEAYLFNNSNLKTLLLLHDSRREVQEEEQWICNVAREKRLIVVLTKADKLSRNELSQAKGKVKTALAAYNPKIFATSLIGKRKLAMDTLAQEVCARCIE